MTPLQRVVMAAKQVKHFCTVKVDEYERYQIVIKAGSYESIRRLARALDGITEKK